MSDVRIVTVRPCALGPLEFKVQRGTVNSRTLRLAGVQGPLTPVRPERP